MCYLFAYKLVLFDYYNDEEHLDTIYGMVGANIDTIAAAAEQVEKNWGIDDIYRLELTRVYDGAGGCTDAKPEDIVEAFKLLGCTDFDKEEKKNE